MEYERTDDGQIQAAFAQRVGQVLVQYDAWRNQVPLMERYESTLTIALLQSLLTMCQELLRKKRLPRELEAMSLMASRSLEQQPTLLGLSADCIRQRWPTEHGLTYRTVIEFLRHALSHPGSQCGTRLPRTGFTTVPGTSDLIEVYEFTQSPWVSSSGSDLTPKYFSKDTGNSPPAKLVEEINQWARNNGVSGLFVEKVNGRWQAVMDGEPFIPVLRLQLNVSQLRVFTMGLSDYLSEPMRSLPVESPFTASV
jgi:hypothetical protein